MTKKHPLLGSLLALACGLACAQSNVTLYGKFDIGLRQAIGSAVKEVATGSDSRIGFKGTEDLGGGLKAFFGMEHRLLPDTGMQDSSTFWKGYSIVGLQGSMGKLTLGRQYTAAFSLVQNQIDPFGGDTVAQVRDVAMRVGGITKVRVNASLRYDVSMQDFNFAASIAEADKNGGPDRPVSLALNWKSGPLLLAAGVENPAGKNDRQWNLGAGYAFGPGRFTAGYADGRTDAGVRAKGYVLGFSSQIGGGELRAAYGQQKLGSVTKVSKLGLGYHYALSKRTTLYTDLGHDSKASSRKTGLDAGILHLF